MFIHFFCQYHSPFQVFRRTDYDGLVDRIINPRFYFYQPLLS